MIKLIPRSKMYKKINSLKKGDSILENYSDENSSKPSTYEQLRYDYLKAIENPDNVGYDPNTNKWTVPKQSIYDSNLIGIGLDIKNNNIVRNYLEKTGRTENPWLTLEEMLLLLNLSLQYLENVFEKNTKGMKPSDIKRAVAIGLLYHGYGPKLWKGNLHNIFVNGTDLDFIDAVSNFYGSNSRALRHSLFWNHNF